MTNEAFARIKIDQLLKNTDWRLTDGISVRYEYPLDDGGRADYAPDWDKMIVFPATKRHAKTLAPMFDEVFTDKKMSKTKRDQWRHVSHHRA